jgi:CxxC motif-containing protein (DUF1111 family)
MAIVLPCLLVVAVLAIASGGELGGQQRGVFDPGVRGGDPGAGNPMEYLTQDESAFFLDGQNRFAEIETVQGGPNVGLGPRFNSNQCLSCHAQPAAGGSSPALNPLIVIATLSGARNIVPWFEAVYGPAREARFKSDGGVHNLFVISGRSDAQGCSIPQPNFSPAGNPITGQGGNSNIIFRIPTPVFGAGLIEAIPDAAILANMAADANEKSSLGITGTPNLSGNDGTITRFGWKAQNKSLLMFAGEAYNVEMGISNQLFPQERDETPSCLYDVPTPNDTLNFTTTTSGTVNPAVLSDIEAFANFMRMLAPPKPAAQTPSTENGRAIFAEVGCAECHHPSFTTGQYIASGSETSPSAAMSYQTANLFSDLLLHHMGSGLADGITQGGAGPDQFRTAPLWGLGQRVYFLHDGRTSNLVQAIQDHAGQGSEANQVINNFNQLSTQDQQDLINFLRSL